MPDASLMLRRVDAAAYLQEHHGVRASTQTLARKAVEGSGPIYRLSGRFPLYHPSDLDAWAKAQLSAPRTRTNGTIAGKETGE